VADDSDVSVVQALMQRNRAELVKLLECEPEFLRDIATHAEHQRRLDAIAEFENMLGEELPERDWQKWFQTNDWILGSDFVDVQDDRRINVENIADYLVKSVDQHLDIIEIKLPKAPFWCDWPDHENLVPRQELVRSVVQGQNYVYELELQMNINSELERLRGPIAKPRVLLIYGRSDSWDVDRFRAQRLLNAGYTDVQVLTYDQVLLRAKRAAGVKGA